MNKKIIALAAAIIIAFGSTGTPMLGNSSVFKPLMASAERSGDWEYSPIQGSDGPTGEYQITSYLGNEESITIPAEIDGHPITKIRSLGINDGNATFSEVIIPVTIKEIEIEALGLSNIKAITVDPDNQSFKSEEGILYTKDMKKIIICPRKKSGDIFIPEGVETIENYAFNSCRYITGKVTLPETMRSIGIDAFWACCLSEINIPAGVKNITNAFGYNPNLETINIDPANENIKMIDGVLYQYADEVMADGLKDSVQFITEDAKTLHLRSHDMYFSTRLFGSTYPGNTNKYILDFSEPPTPELLSQIYYPLKINNIIIDEVDGEATALEYKIINDLLFMKEHTYVYSGAILRDEYILWYIPYDAESITIPNETFVEHKAFENRPNLKKVIFEDNVVFENSDVWKYNETAHPLNIRFCCNENSTAAEFFRTNNIPYYPIDEQTPGDITGDGNVNMRDLATLQRYINGWDVQVDETTADVNKDGSVNMRDYALVQRFINGWDVELK